MITEFFNTPTWARFFLQIIPWLFLFMWTAYSVVALFFREPDWKFTGFDIIQNIPAIFVTLGVLGTFAGVTYGLLDFNLNPEEISQSITGLLDGLKSAFFTSLYGLFLSVCSNIIIRFQYANGFLEDPEVQDQRLLLSNLENAIDSFGENLAEYNSKAIMSSLKKVINDFNDTFTELIGELVTENFQKLTQSIDQLVEWQLEYKEDVNNVIDTNKTLNKRSKDLISSFEQVETSVSNIGNSASQVKNALDLLRDSIEDDSSIRGLITKLENTTENLEAISEDADLFKKEIERIANNLLETQQEVQGWLDREDGIRDATDTLNQTLKDLRKFHAEQIKELDESFSNRLKSTFENLDRLIESYIKYIKDKNGQER